jgi:hypothetical protein
MAREMEKARKATSSPKTSTMNAGPKSPVRNGGGSPPHKKNTTEYALGKYKEDLYLDNRSSQSSIILQIK